MPVELPQRLANHQTNHAPATAHLGKEGGLASGDGWGQFGERRPDQTSETAERRRWREGCLQAGAVTAPRWAIAGRMGIRVAVSVTVQQRDSTQRHIV